jgi:hypothetical protein
VTAYDTGAPVAEVRETVFITIDRNLFAPVFDELSYETTIYDFNPIGTSVITVNAEDADTTTPENLVNYDLTDISNNNLFSNMFSIHPISGLITTNRLLTTENVNVYRVSAYILYVHCII